MSDHRCFYETTSATAVVAVCCKCGHRLALDQLLAAVEAGSGCDAETLRRLECERWAARPPEEK